jgi:hypothetical protein
MHSTRTTTSATLSSFSGRIGHTGGCVSPSQLPVLDDGPSRWVTASEDSIIRFTRSYRSWLSSTTSENIPSLSSTSSTPSSLPPAIYSKTPYSTSRCILPADRRSSVFPPSPPNKSYVIQASAMMEELIEPASEGQLFFLDCNWTLDFM